MQQYNFVTGIDDIGTMSGKSEGWTFITFNEEYYQEFKKAAQDILNDSGLKSFHGKEFKRKKSEYYSKFLILIRETLAKGCCSFVCCTLLDEGWKKQFREFCDTLIGNAFQQANVDNDEITEASKKIAAPLFTFQRLSSHKICAQNTLIDIDKDSILSNLNNRDLYFDGKKISSKIPIFASLAAYGKKQFPNAPIINRQSINILNDEESFLIQAADIIGNFSTALVFKALGKDSKSNNRKCKVIEGVFGDLIDATEVSNNVKLIGDDLELEESGSFTFCIE